VDMDSGLLGKLSHADLLRMRERESDPEVQKRLAPYEHQAYARELVRRNKMNAVGLLGAIPGYQLAKLLGVLPVDEKSTPASFAQLYGGLKGLGQGLFE